MLLSAGASLFPFTGTPEVEYFRDYCTALGISWNSDTDCRRAFDPRVIDPRIGTTNSVNGYSWLLELINNCPGASFQKARDGVTFARGGDMDQFLRDLQEENASSIVTVNPNHHSISLFFSRSIGYYFRDSAFGGIPMAAEYDACASNPEKLIRQMYPKNATIGDRILFCAR